MGEKEGFHSFDLRQKMLQYTNTVAQRCSVKNMFVQISECQSLFFLMKFQAKACNSIKKRLWHRCFERTPPVAVLHIPNHLKETFYWGLLGTPASFFWKVLTLREKKILVGPVPKVLAFSWKTFFRIWSEKLLDFGSVSFHSFRNEKCDSQLWCLLLWGLFEGWLV